MSNTGTYKLEEGVLVKISDRIPKISTDVTFTGSEEVLDIDDKPVVVRSKKQKERELKKRGLIELLPGEKITDKRKEKDWSKLTSVLEQLPI